MESEASTRRVCLDCITRGFTHLDEKALGSNETQQFIPPRQYTSLINRHRELKAQHAVLDWTTAFPSVYKKKTMKTSLRKAALPRKCKHFEKAAEKWRKDAEHAATLADSECQLRRKERLTRYRLERKSSVFDKHLSDGDQSPTMLEFLPQICEARSGNESSGTLPPEDGHSRASVPWSRSEVDSCSLTPSTGVSSRRSTLSDAKKPAPWLTRSPSGNSFRDNPVVAETFRVRTTSTHR